MVDAMAASSGGVEWSSIIKPILSASYGSVNKHDVLELCSAINKRYLTPNDQFFSLIIVLQDLCVVGFSIF